ncbi:MAG TPA: lysophospholipid acyltransferase family protein [Chitinophagaceae bacterium]|nr:lysophospholipid acyltransferase family protein [Chitinophagaceae bacterium]
MKILLKPFHWIYLIYAAVTFIALMIIVFPFVIIASLFGKIKGGNAVYKLCTVWGDAWWFLIGIRHKNIYESPVEKNKQYIFVANHISYLDAPIIVKSFRMPIRVLGKIEMTKVPIFGYIYKNAIVTVDRRDAERRAKSVRILKSVLRKGISIFIFPEGTFNTTGKPLKDFFDGAFRMAIETQTPIKPALFLDGYSRMNYRSLFSLNPGRSRTIFLEEVDVSAYSMHDVQKLKEEVYSIMRAKLMEYHAPWINFTAEGAENVR